MRKFLIFALILPFFWACNSNSPEALSNKLIEIDKAMGGANVTDKAKAAAFVKTSEELALMLEKTNKDQYVDVLLKAAGLAKTIGNPQKSIELYQKVADGLPQHPKAPTALFMIGFVYETDMSDLPKAKATYESFLQKYPNDPDFADDAQTALSMLGRSPEDIIKEFEAKQRTQEAQQR